MRKTLLVLLWFPASVVVVVLNFTLLARTSTAQQEQHKQTVVIQPKDTSIPVAGSQEGTAQVLGAEVVSADARPLLIKDFLERHDSPMSEYYEVFVTEADQYGIDFRLVAAIAMCESNLGKKIPKDSYNAWGIAVYTGKNSGKSFSSWPEAIGWVSRYMKEKYYDRGYIDLQDIGAIYAPPSVDTDYSWTRCVEKFQNSIS